MELQQCLFCDTYMKSKITYHNGIPQIIYNCDNCGCSSADYVCTSDTKTTPLEEGCSFSTNTNYIGE